MDVYSNQLGSYVKINLYNCDLNSITQNSVRTAICLGRRVYPCRIQQADHKSVSANAIREYPGQLKVQLTRGYSDNKTYYVVVYLINKRTMERETYVRITQEKFSFLPLAWDIAVDPDATYDVRINVCYFSNIDMDDIDLYVAHEWKSVLKRREIFTQEELQRLEKERARSFVQGQGGTIRPIQYFYRNKPPEYFEPILAGSGIMEPYIKDMNGDPRCPTNGRINGLFFMGRPDRNRPNCLPKVSPFGPMRFIIPAQRLFGQDKNLYFSDFWCHNVEHYVSLVITVPGSEADRFCQRHLFQLDKYDNLYLKLGLYGQVFISDCVWVEVLYTEAINIMYERRAHGASMTTVRAIGPGQSTRLGVLKRTNCRICNLDNNIQVPNYFRSQFWDL